MSERILVPLDGFKRAETILPHVEDLAHRYDKSQVILLQVVLVVLASCGRSGFAHFLLWGCRCRGVASN